MRFDHGELEQAATVLTRDGQVSPAEMLTPAELRAIAAALGPHIDQRRLALASPAAAEGVAFGVLVGLELARQRIGVPRVPM